MTPPRLIATGHPLQRAGSTAVAVMVGRSTVDGVTAADLHTVTREIVAAAAEAALARRANPGYGWFKALNNHFPNSPVTQPSNKGKSKADLSELVTGVIDAVDSQPGG